jgi:hypothetical protein
LNVALHNSPDEHQQQTFLRYIEELTVWHLRILLLYHDVEGYFREHPLIPGQNVGGASQLLELAFPELLAGATCTIKSSMICIPGD